MSNDNEQALDTEEPEEQEVEQTADETVTLSKGEFRKLTRRSIAYEALKKTPQAPIIQPKQEPSDDITATVQQLKLAEEKRQFGFENSLSPQETDLAFKFSGGKPDQKILEDEFFKGGLESMRSRQRLANNTPGASTGGMSYQGKSFTELSEPERQKAFEEKMKGFKK